MLIKFNLFFMIYHITPMLLIIILYKNKRNFHIMKT